MFSVGTIVGQPVTVICPLESFEPIVRNPESTIKFGFRIHVKNFLLVLKDSRLNPYIEGLPTGSRDDFFVVREDKFLDFYEGHGGKLLFSIK